MGAKDHTAEHSLDQLARGLANGSVSRRKALRLMGGILAGTVLGSVPGIALTQRAAEAALRSCRDASACCACTYFDETTREVFQSTCETEVGRTCEGRRIQTFFTECEQRCNANAPAGAAVKTHQTCEPPHDSPQRTVCRQRASGERICKFRSCSVR
jgi:hypothetical protein